MKRSDIESISRAVVEQREARRGLSPTQRQRFDIERDAGLLSAYRRDDPEATARFLVQVAMRLQDGEILGGNLRNWLANALVESALDPSKAAAAFGLVRLANRPKSEKTEFRDISIADRILDLSSSMSINSASSDSAIARAAKEFRVSEAVAERAWKRWRKLVVAGREGTHPS